MDIEHLTARLSNLTLSDPPVRLTIPYDTGAGSHELSIPQQPPTKHPNALRRIPPEIRVMIYQYDLGIRAISDKLRFEWRVVPLPPPVPVTPAVPVQPTQVFNFRGSVTRRSAMVATPNLLVALRAVPDLYWEALEVFYAINMFFLDVTTCQRFRELSREAVQLIQCVSLDLRYDPRFPKYKPVARDLVRLYEHRKSNLTAATGIRRALILTSANDPTLYPLFINNASNWKNLREVTIIDLHHAKIEELEKEAQMLKFIKQWLRVQDHTKDWVFSNPQIPQPPPPHFMRWRQSVFQWMSPKDFHFGHLKYRLVSREKTS